eukprot:2013333-Rhodomonas_salina.1
MPGPQMLPLEQWFPRDNDSRWAWHDQRQAGRLTPVGADSPPPPPGSAASGRSHRPARLPLDEGGLPPQ